MFDSEAKELTELAVLDGYLQEVGRTSFQSLYDRGN